MSVSSFMCILYSLIMLSCIFCVFDPLPHLIPLFDLSIVNVSGHRIGTAEVESALVGHPAVAQAAVVGKPHDLKGQAICAFCMLKNGFTESPELLTELKIAVRNEVGAFCAPDVIVISPSLPMTRSGKIMRRILRKIVSGETDSLGDTSTLADPSIVDTLIEKVTKPKEVVGRK